METSGSRENVPNKSYLAKFSEYVIYIIHSAVISSFSSLFTTGIKRLMSCIVIMLASWYYKFYLGCALEQTVPDASDSANNTSSTANDTAIITTFLYDSLKLLGAVATIIYAIYTIGKIFMSRKRKTDTWKTLQHELKCRCSELSTKIRTSNLYNHEQELLKLDSEFKTRIKQEDPDMQQALLSSYTEEYQKQVKNLSWATIQEDPDIQKALFDYYEEKHKKQPINLSWDMLQDDPDIQKALYSSYAEKHRKHLINPSWESVQGETYMQKALLTSYKDKHQKQPVEVSWEILQEDPDVKKALLSSYSEKYQKQSINHRSENFKRSAERNLNNETEHIRKIFSELDKLIDNNR
jgi:hypothetical protein